MPSKTDSTPRDASKRKAAYMALYQAENRERLNEYARQRRADRGDLINAQTRARYAKDPSRTRAVNAAWAAKNRTRIRKNNARYRSENRDKIGAQRFTVRERDAACKKKWQAKNRERIAAYMAEYERARMVSDPAFRLRKTLRNRIRAALNGSYRLGSPVDWLGCSPAEAKAHIEAQFQPGMTWQNWSPTGWHVDHKKPLASFDLSVPAQLRAACHYTNLQPLWARDNLTKGCRDAATTNRARHHEL